MVSSFEGAFRFQLNYRDQWSSLVGSSSFRTFALAADWKQALSTALRDLHESGQAEIAGVIVPEVEKILMDFALSTTGGRKNEAAKLLGWGRNTLTRKLKDHVDISG